MVHTQAEVGLDSFDHDPKTEEYRAVYDASTVPPSLALASALSAAMEADPTDIDPIYESLDPDALDGLVGDPTRSGEPITISFSVEHFQATISNTGDIFLDPQSGTGSDAGTATEGTT